MIEPAKAQDPFSTENFGDYAKPSFKPLKYNFGTIYDKWAYQIPINSYDPDSPKISCKIGELYVDGVVLDTGASCNMLPYSSYLKIGNGVLVEDNTVVIFSAPSKDSLESSLSFE